MEKKVFRLLIKTLCFFIEKKCWEVKENGKKDKLIVKVQINLILNGKNPAKYFTYFTPPFLPILYPFPIFIKVRT